MKKARLSTFFQPPGTQIPDEPKKLMKILIVCSFNGGKISPFVYEQAEAIKKHNISVEFYGIKGKGFAGYLKNYFPLLKEIKNYRPDLIHAHYGLSGLLANLQRKVPVITTFHGSDLNNAQVLKYSNLSKRMSHASIFVSQSMEIKGIKKNKYYIIPCGVDLTQFNSLPKIEARQMLGYQQNEIIILFSSSFDRKVKNYPLAEKACSHLEKIILKKVKLLELKNYSRKEVNLLINSADCALLTSISEGSPQFIKEAMACNCPVVATDVGDVSWLFGGEAGHFIAKFDYQDVAEKINAALQFSEKYGKTKGRERIQSLGLDSKVVADRIVKIYKETINK